jgi:hypothetical protein
MVTVDDVRSFERGHGRIPDGALVCMNSGWAAKVGDPLAFKGGAAFPDYHFPGFGVDAAMWLARERNVTAIGVDTMSLDPGNSSTFPVHVNFLATDRYGLENLNNLEQIPPRGALAYVGLIPWEEGSGGPCRVIANFVGPKPDPRRVRRGTGVRSGSDSRASAPPGPPSDPRRLEPPRCLISHRAGIRPPGPVRPNCARVPATRSR